VAVKVNPNPTFKWPVKFTSPEGEQTINFNFRHMTAEEHDAWWQAAVQRYMDYRVELEAHAKAVAEAAEKAKAEGKDAPEAPPEPKMAKTALDEVMEVVAGWDEGEVDEPFSREVMGKLMSNYHDLTAKKICQAWSDGLTQRKREN
jgi:hypothetical protein